MTLRLALLPMVLVVAGMACGDDSDGGGAGAGSSAGSGAGTGGGGMLSGSPADKAAMCSAMMMGGMDDSCTGVDAYVDCVQTACDAGYKTCLGPNYMTGDFSGGMCAPYGDCLASATDCSCMPDAMCLNCFTSNLVSCALSCPLPMCTGGGAGAGAGSGVAGVGGTTGSKTCADLEACCNSLDQANKDQCTTMLNAIKVGGDLACSVAYSAYASLGCM